MTDPRQELLDLYARIDKLEKEAEVYKQIMENDRETIAVMDYYILRFGGINYDHNKTKENYRKLKERP